MKRLHDMTADELETHRKSECPTYACTVARVSAMTGRRVHADLSETSRHGLEDTVGELERDGWFLVRRIARTYRRQAADLYAPTSPARKLAEVRGILWPDGDKDHPWEGDTIERVAAVVDHEPCP